MTLGLDASTSVCGWAIFNGEKIVDAGFIDILKLNQNKDKSYKIISGLEQSKYLKQIKVINLEAALSGFLRGRTSQQVVIKLTRFNAVLEYILSEHFNLPVKLIGANTARKKVLGKAFIKGMKSKEYVKQKLPTVFPEITKFEQKNNKNNWNEKNSDMYDAVVIAAA